MTSRILKPVAALVVAVGLTTISISAPASAVTVKKSPTVVTNDTGWGRRL